MKEIVCRVSLAAFDKSGEAESVVEMALTVSGRTALRHLARAILVAVETADSDGAVTKEDPDRAR